ncbi:MAG: HEPN domain-containing protein [Candidatus Kapaibacterium sp.]|nr:MAG: HEPN domain-containing protein [Candidatus Kapabacteria bacterium]
MKESFIARAKENILDAEIAFNGGRYNACANRAYYAAFHAAIAALKHFGHTPPSIDHSPVSGNFSKYLIHERKVFPSTITNELKEIMKIRGKADYSETGIGKQLAAAQLKRATIFVHLVLQKIEEP